MGIPELDERLGELVKGCLRNDRRAQKELYRHYYATAMGVCLRYANNKEDAASILNEGFYKVFSHISSYDFARSFTIWISKIMTNTAIDFYRANLRFTNHTYDLEHLEYVDNEAQSIIGRLHYKDLLSMIHSLSPAYRAVFNLYAIEGYPHEEIAQLLGISIGTSKSNLFKARAKLMEMLKVSDLVGSKKNINLEE